MSDRATHLLWVDLETTGLDPAQDNVIEAAVIMSDVSLKAKWTFQSVVRPDAFALDRLMKNDIVRPMHEASGLLPLLKHGEHIMEVDRLLSTSIKRNAPDAKILLAGSGVGHHDKAFMLRWMPETFALLQYPVIDIGVIRRFLRDIVGAEYLIPDDGDSATKTHRAMDDVSQHFREGTYYMKVLQQVDFAPILAQIETVVDARVQPS